MSEELQKIDAVVAKLTEDGAPFALETVTIDGAEYRSFAKAPGNMGDYFRFMLNHADKEFAVYRDERLTFGESYAQASALARSLIDDYGVQPGDRVAILSRNNPQWMLGFIATLSIGAVAVPMNAWWTTEELDYGLKDCGAKVVIADRQRLERLVPLQAELQLALIAVDDCSGLDLSFRNFRDLVGAHQGAEMPVVDVAPDDYATIMYTSGSTGHPKGALSSHRGMLSALYSWMLLGTSDKQAAGKKEPAKFPPSGLLTIPLFHCTGSHTAFLLSLIVGRKLVIMHKWDVQEALRIIEEERITWFTGVPTMSAELQAAAAESDRDLSSLAEIYGGGAARPPAQVEKLAKTFKHSSAGIGYGLTETNALGTINTGAVYRARPGSAGRVVPAVTDIAILDENDQPLPAGERGEVCIHSPANCLGYWNKPEATAEAFRDGWFHTGDVGYMDEDGFLFIVDRIKEIIIRGGENISCIEVEAGIYQHPAILEAAVYGVPDERLGEAVAASVVLREGETLTTEGLQEFLREHIAGFKIPAHVRFHDEALPRIATGKIFKRQLKAELSETLAAA
ncbi:class I adenylate-forming enzyme family protein [Congregibacter litoralis]|uniref:Acyl-CoA synthetase (AMP-forming)/AMP-acid ligase II n=1 Tax=Congregibacter litoralis KT71 TaxID=314285 RepID=A4A9W8_9GAMM|nr:class I adenylate-forming enzyme family protein [Congregibacter litoralis]EAQ97285.1 Acyl-CoA synthetase (AMP-forming)/AMP-acid ligase II [Congregibacter litoralis KT71]